MNTYLLEKSRITSQLADEQNYHVMYMVAGCLPDKVRRAYEMPAWEQFSYLNVRDKKKVEWEEFPTTFKELEDAMATIPTVKPYAETAWKILAAILHLGNAKFKGSGEDDAIFDSGPSLGIVSRLLGCETEQLNKAVCTLNIKAGLDWIAKPNTTTYAQSAKDALSKALYSRLFDKLVENINESLMFGGDTRFFIGAVDIFGFECFPRNSLEQLCINFANEKLQRMFTEAVFESVLAEYTKEGIDVGGMSFEVRERARAPPPTRAPRTTAHPPNPMRGWTGRDASAPLRAPCAPAGQLGGGRADRGLAERPAHAPL